VNQELVGTFIPIVAIVMSLLIPIVFQITDYRRRRDLVEALHRERMASIERGIEPKPLPEELLNPFRRNRNPRYLLTGMIWLFIGIGLFVFLGAVAGHDVRWLGLIPGGIGLAYLLYHLIEGRHEKAEFARAGSADVTVPPRVS
jgi:hypothetical protein